MNTSRSVLVGGRGLGGEGVCQEGVWELINSSVVRENMMAEAHHIKKINYA